MEAANKLLKRTRTNRAWLISFATRLAGRWTPFTTFLGSRVSAIYSSSFGWATAQYTPVEECRSKANPDLRTRQLGGPVASIHEPPAALAKRNGSAAMMSCDVLVTLTEPSSPRSARMLTGFVASHCAGKDDTLGLAMRQVE